MADPIKWRSKIILAKINSDAYGTDPVPTGAANAILMTDVELRPMEGQDVSRNLERPFIGAQQSVPVGVHVVLTGSVELVGSGDTGVAPAWGPLMRMCGVAEVVTPDDAPGDGTVEYTPVSDEHEDGAIYFWIGPTQHKMTGVRGDWEWTHNAQAIPVVRFTLTGLFAAPADATRPTVDLTGFQPPQVATKTNTPTFTLGGVPLVLSQFSFKLGNAVEQRLLIGREAVLINDRNEQIAARVEAVPLTTFNPFAAAFASTEHPLVLEHGTVAGKRIKLEAPHCTVARLSGYEQSQNVLEWPLSLSPQPLAGDDQWTLTLS
ncbi:MAG: hypothetical protein J0I69_02740 [Altererythrobacter sp.]|nr:hypothetical protein [Altererythrobacter sp.]OJU60937.1 MAG: hypothetical protein BGO08_12490 [Altererythrobacter sp. 66-12]